MFEPPLDRQVADTSSKGPRVAHALPVYKKAGKLQNSARWKNANLVTNVVGGKDFRLRETHGEGRFDETGMYRDWVYGEERRWGNIIGITCGLVSFALFYYTLNTLGAETWDLPAPLMSRPPDVAAKPVMDAAPPTMATRPTKGNATVVQ